LSPLCADCLEIWEPQPSGTLRTCPGVYGDCFTLPLPCGFMLVECPLMLHGTMRYCGAPCGTSHVAWYHALMQRALRDISCCMVPCATVARPAGHLMLHGTMRYCGAPCGTSHVAWYHALMRRALRDISCCMVPCATVARPAGHPRSCGTESVVRGILGFLEHISSIV
jgi:hypothetical protein